MSDVISLNGRVRCPFFYISAYGVAITVSSLFTGRHLFLIANFTPRIGRGTIICAGVLVCGCACGWMDMAVEGICTVCFSFGTWCHRCVARYQCVTALELTDESTEPDPGIAFGCKPLTLTLLLGDVLYTLCILFLVFCLLLFSCAISCNLVSVFPHPSLGILEAVSYCRVVLCVCPH